MKYTTEPSSVAELCKRCYAGLATVNSLHRSSAVGILAVRAQNEPYLAVQAYPLVTDYLREPGPESFDRLLRAMTEKVRNLNLTTADEKAEYLRMANLALSLAGGAIDTLTVAVENGPRESGDLPSKSAAASLIRKGLMVMVVMGNDSEFYSYAATILGAQAYCFLYGQSDSTAEARAWRKTQNALTRMGKEAS